jgi:hypothetical protein
MYRTLQRTIRLLTEFIWLHHNVQYMYSTSTTGHALDIL